MMTKTHQLFALLFILMMIGASTCKANQSQNKNETSQTADSINFHKTWLTPAEQSWLDNLSIINHGMVGGKMHMPFEYIDDLGMHQGLTSDYLQIISEKLGVEIRSTLRTTGFDELGMALKSEQIDLSSYIPKTIHLASQIHFSKAIIKMPVVLLGRQSTAIMQGLDFLDKERVSVQKGTYAHKLLFKNNPNVEVTFVNSTVAGLEALDNNETDVFIHNIFSAEYFQRKLGIKGLKVLATTQYDYEIMFAVSNTMAPLIPIIEKAIADISEREKRLIFDKWINIQIEEKLDIKLITISLLCVSFVVILIIMVFSHWNRQLTDKVAERTAELRNLARHMERVREEEKAKLAREIHDELGHTLTALAISIRRLRTCKDETERNKKSEELTELVRNASQTSKRIMSDLRPSILEDLGLDAAIEWLAREFNSRHDIICHVTVHEAQTKLKEETAIALFRITQESLTNIAKHAHASQVEIIITLQDKELLLLISDDGQGLNLGWETKEGSYGLQGMRERALALGGSLTVKSKLHKGVQLLVTIPID